MGEYLGMKKNSLLILLAILLSLPCFANQNIINSVLISKSKEDSSKYELSIDSTKTVQYKMHKDEQGVWFELKNSILAQNAGTIMMMYRILILFPLKLPKTTELIFIFRAKMLKIQNLFLSTHYLTQNKIQSKLCSQSR